MKLFKFHRTGAVRSLLLAAGALTVVNIVMAANGVTEKVVLGNDFVIVRQGDHSTVELYPTRSWLGGQIHAALMRLDGSPLTDLEVKLVPIRPRDEFVPGLTIGQMTLEEAKASRQITLDLSRTLVGKTDQLGQVSFAHIRPGWYSLQPDWQSARAEPKIKVQYSFQTIKRAAALLPLVPLTD